MKPFDALDKNTLSLCAVAVLGLAFLFPAYAQSIDTLFLDEDIIAETPLREGTATELAALKDVDFSLNPAKKSLFFTDQEYSALKEARTYTGVTRPDDIFEEFEDEEEMGVEIEMPPPEERYIKLGGILYESRNIWTIWLNGERVTPDALPEEVLDLKVYNNYVEMRWYDKYTKRIIPLRIRPNERFHMDARIFLPG